MVTAKVAVTLTVMVDVSFQEERIESYDGFVYGIDGIELIGAEDLGVREATVLWNRAQDIALSQFDVLELIDLETE